MSIEILNAVIAVKEATTEDAKIQKKRELKELIVNKTEIRLDLTDDDGSKFEEEKEDEYMEIFSEALQTNATIKNLKFNSSFSPFFQGSCALSDKGRGYLEKALQTNINLTAKPFIFSSPS